MNRLSIQVAIAAFAAITAHAQTFNVLANFNGINGGSPLYVALAQGGDGNFYGTTELFGSLGFGTVFKMTPQGLLTTIYNFCAQPRCADGQNPAAGLVPGADGNFYGTTLNGGANNSGTVFKITPSGTETVLYSFCPSTNCPDGAHPNAALVQGTDGNFYGTTSGGQGPGTPVCGSLCGAIFKVTPAGALTTLHNFTGPDGFNPYAPLVQGTDGNFYGTTVLGGANDTGTVFKITPGGAFTSLFSFGGDGSLDGFYPYAGLVQGSDRSFYGTTQQGGPAGGGGTIFKITAGGSLTTLYGFSGPDGAAANAGLIQATDGNFYGVAQSGGDNGCGTIFQFKLPGTLTTLHSFSGSVDGCSPTGKLVQATNGTFYGTTDLGGSGGDGNVFGLGTGLGPFITTDPTSGKVGSPAQIFGNNLTGTTAVSFHGRAATFTVVSDSEITTSVPSGASTGKVQVTTPGGTIASNVPFRVTPVISSFSPTSGTVGTVVTITGKSLVGASAVTFGGVKATTFTVDSYTQITATVPVGAKTGKIRVTTAGGAATSAGTFTVH